MKESRKREDILLMKYFCLEKDSFRSVIVRVAKRDRVLCRRELGN